jgi:serpin B
MKQIRLRPNRSTILFVVIAVLATVMLTTSDCALGTAAKVVHSDLVRETSPQVNSHELQELVVGNSEFALRLYQELRTNEGNLFYSPYSISVALAMTYAGARGDTEQEIMETLAFSLSQDRLHPAFNALDLELASRAASIGTVVGEQEGPELIVANSLWCQVDHTFWPKFLDVLALNYGAGMRLIDYENNPEAACRVINAWVSDRTERKIKDMVPAGALDASTRLVLANAIYFNADWDSPFKRFNTKSGTFHLLDGDEIQVPMMYQAERLLYAKGEGYQLVELPYVQREIVMDILIPNPGEFRAVVSSLDASRVIEILRELDYQGVMLTLPKFEFESDFALSDTLAEMGMPSAFSLAADFSGMDGARDLNISEVLHKAFISVDEEGAEAGAASTVFAQVISGLGPAIEVKMDRPFVFWIRDLPTGTVLFVGRVLNPAQ